MAITIPVDVIKKLAAQLGSQLEKQLRQTPSGSKPESDELEKIMNALLQSALARLDLVSRNEFDAQRQVLSRTRARLEAVEKIVLDNSKHQGDSEEQKNS